MEAEGIELNLSKVARSPTKKEITSYGWSHLSDSLSSLQEELKSQMKTILETQEGCEFVSRPQAIELPSIDDEILNASFGDTKKAREVLDMLNNFFHYDRIKDKFGKYSEPEQYERRKEWKQAMIKKYPRLFQVVYGKNQFAGNRITEAIGQILRLHYLAKKNGNHALSVRLKSYGSELIASYHGMPLADKVQQGKKYPDMNYDEKELFLNGLEPRLREVINIVKTKAPQQAEHLKL